MVLSAAEVEVRLHQPPAGQLAAENLWWVDLDNRTQNTYTCYLHGEIWEARRGLVFKANSREFQLPPGSKRLRGRKDVDPLRDIWYARGYEQFAVRTGGLPEGRYQFIVLLEPDLGGDTIEFEVSLPGPPRLVSPRDGMQLPMTQRQPMFSWTPPQPPVSGVRFVVRVVEVLPGQTKEEAMRSNPPWFEKQGNVSSSLRYPASARRFDQARSYAWQVQALDLNGNLIGSSEIWSFSFGEISPRVPLPPPITINRDVRRIDNYYSVQLTIENNSADTFRDLTVFDRSSAFQCLDDARVMHGTSGASYRATFCSTYTDTTGVRSAVRFGWEGLAPGGRMIVRYHLVPVLLGGSHPVTPTIGDSCTISYRIGPDWVLRGFGNRVVPADVADCLQTADYLIVTCPERLFAANPGGMRNDVYRLLSTMAQLAKEKAGVIGYIPSGWANFDLKAQLRPRFKINWGRRLKPNWFSNGYLLLVGQDDIVPSWDYPLEGWGTVRLSDYPYSNLFGDEQCELRVGRIIGINARELAIPIQTSLDVWRGLARYDGSKGLMVSAAEGPYEGFVVEASELAESLRLRVPDVSVVFGEQFITRISMLREGLLIAYGRDRLKLATLALIERVWNGAPLGTIDQVEEVYEMTAQAIQDSAIALACRALPSKDRPEEDTTLWLIRLVEKLYGSFWEGRIRQPQEYMMAFALMLLEYRGVTPSGDTLTRALREAEEVQYARRGQRLPNYDYFNTVEEAATARSSRVRSQAHNRDIIGYCGHGGPGSWAWVLDDCPTSACPAEPLSFGSHRPVVLGFTCSSGDYTESGGHGPVSIARCFLRNGAGIYIGATRVSFCCTNRNLKIETFRRWSTQEYFGDAFVDLKNTCCLREHNWMLETVMYNLYGDPKYRRR